MAEGRTVLLDADWDMEGAEGAEGAGLVQGGGDIAAVDTCWGVDYQMGAAQGATWRGF